MIMEAWNSNSFSWHSRPYITVTYPAFKADLSPMQSFVPGKLVTQHSLPTSMLCSCPHCIWNAPLTNTVWQFYLSIEDHLKCHLLRNISPVNFFLYSDKGSLKAEATSYTIGMTVTSGLFPPLHVWSCCTKVLPCQELHWPIRCSSWSAQGTSYLLNASGSDGCLVWSGRLEKGACPSSPLGQLEAEDSAKQNSMAGT